MLACVAAHHHDGAVGARLHLGAGLLQRLCIGGWRDGNEGERQRVNTLGLQGGDPLQGLALGTGDDGAQQPVAPPARNCAATATPSAPACPSVGISTGRQSRNAGGISRPNQGANKFKLRCMSCKL